MHILYKKSDVDLHQHYSRIVAMRHPSQRETLFGGANILLQSGLHCSPSMRTNFASIQTISTRSIVLTEYYPPSWTSIDEDSCYCYNVSLHYCFRVPTFGRRRFRTAVLLDELTARSFLDSGRMSSSRRAYYEYHARTLQYQSASVEKSYQALILSRKPNSAGFSGLSTPASPDVVQDPGLFMLHLLLEKPSLRSASSRRLTCNIKTK